MMPDEPILMQLDLLDNYVQDLQQVQPKNFQAYEEDKMLRRYIERMLHMAIDTSIQIGIAILTREGYRSPENYHDVFIVLGEHHILTGETVDCMTAAVELRNLLVYEHSAVDDMMVYGFAKRHLDDIAEFASGVRKNMRPNNTN